MKGGLLFSREQRIVLGIGFVLIALGIGFLTTQLVGSDSIGSWVPFVSGLIVLGIAIVTRLPGFSILGCLLTSAGGGLLWYVYAGKSTADGVAEPVFLLFISGGLFLIPILTRILEGKPLLWPLLPGAAGLIAGIVLLT